MGAVYGQTCYDVTCLASDVGGGDPCVTGLQQKIVYSAICEAISNQVDDSGFALWAGLAHSRCPPNV